MRDRVETIRGCKFIRLRSDRLVSFFDVIREAESYHTDLGRALSRAFLLAEGEWDLERIEWRLDELESHVAALRRHMDEVRGVKSKKERIALLRNITGRTPEEAAEFLRKADELEARL